MPQRRYDPALDHQHPRFDLALVPGLVRACRQDAHAVMPSHFLIGGVEVGFVTASADDAGASVIGDDQLRNALEKFKGADVSAEPVFQSLAPGGFRVGVVAGAQDSDKDESRTVRAALCIVEGDGVPGIIHEELFAGLVLVAQHHVQMAAPAMIELAEAAVAIAVGAALAVFLP